MEKGSRQSPTTDSGCLLEWVKFQFRVLHAGRKFQLVCKNRVSDEVIKTY